MKSIFTISNKCILIILLIIIQKVNAQPYESIFGENSTTWNIAHEVPDAVETDSFYTTFDTIINGYTYKTVFIYSYISGFIREDINTGKAWYLYASDTNETLIMDLSLSIADTFFLLTYVGSDDNNYAIVDSVYYLDSKKIIQFNYYLGVSGIYEKLKFTEGLGCNAGITYHDDHDQVGSHYLLCSTKDEIQYYVTTLYEGDCNYHWTDIESIEENFNSINLYPNPFRTETHLQAFSTQYSQAYLYIYNSAGMRLRTIQFNPQYPLRINRDGLARGFYYFNVEMNNAFFGAGKFIIN